MCEKGFSTNGVLKNHLRIHTGEKPFACSKCSAKFTELSNLNKHMTVHSSKSDIISSILIKGVFMEALTPKPVLLGLNA